MIKQKIKSIEWFKTGEGQYLGGEQIGILYVDLSGKRKQLHSVHLLGNGAVHRQNLDDLSDLQWETLQAEYEKIMTVPTTSGFACGKVYKSICVKPEGLRKKVWRLF